MPQQDHACGARVRIGRLESAAERRPDAEQLEEAGPDLERIHAEGLTLVGDGRLSGAVRRHALERRLALAQIDEVADGDELLRDPGALVAMVEDDELVGLTIW